MRSEHRYALGHDAFEIERLQLQSTVIGSVTRRLIEQSGVRPGMHVLDIGCGVGDVSMLLTEAVGETGSVVAFDREPRAIAVARARALAAGYRCIEFVMASDEFVSHRGRFRRRGRALHPCPSGRSPCHDPSGRSCGVPRRHRCVSRTSKRGSRAHISVP